MFGVDCALQRSVCNSNKADYYYYYYYRITVVANDSEMIIAVTCDVIYCNVSVYFNSKYSVQWSTYNINEFQKTHFTIKIYCLFLYLM